MEETLWQKSGSNTPRLGVFKTQGSQRRGKCNTKATTFAQNREKGLASDPSEKKYMVNKKGV